jgi:diaminohydroxyphosphoribosylaminopyrimidine deaminase/5-amino-6-(5-phosphoribosylamino)uracil reductase
MNSLVDERYLRMACGLALRARGRTSPNPLVGAVLVRKKKIIATGFHKFAGGDHAEIVALKRARSRAKGATLYINLEPCSHQGRTPPCTRSLIAAGIKEVVAGMKDPNPLVAGRGFRELRRAGINVRVGILEEECRRINEAFIKYMTDGRPFVTLKLAASLDGKIASGTGDARWVSDLESRGLVQRLRSEMDAVVVGAGTALADNPRLTCRIPGGRNPWRVLLDSRLRTPPSAALFHQRDPEKTIVATSTRTTTAKVRALVALKAQVWRFPLERGRIPWRPLLKILARLGILSVMIEGGAAIAASAIRAKVVDKVLFFYAPKIIGGDGRVMIDGLGVQRMRAALPVKRLSIKKLGNDFLVSGYL